MGPLKVNSIANWKVPTSKELVMSFVGAVGYLAPNCPNICIPMSILNSIAASMRDWKWGSTEQQVFDKTKATVEEWQNHHRKPINYAPNARPVNLVTDPCLTGTGAHILQGKDLKTAKVVAFWSAKFSSAKQNYPMHKQELLAIVKSLKHFQNLLQGIP
jgi:hypothetical protein